MQGNTIGVTDSGAPRSLLVELDGEHGLGVDGVVVLYPLQTSVLIERVVADGLVVGVSPQVAEVGNELVTRVVDAVVDVGDDILLGQRGAVVQGNRSQRIVACANQVSC